MNTQNIPKMILKIIAKEICSNETLVAEITQILNQNIGIKDKNGSPHPHRRQPSLFDPFQVYREETEMLMPKLSALDIEQLKDIIAEHGMDRKKLAMKWKKKERLIELIIKTVESRSQKGDAFRINL